MTTNDDILNRAIGARDTQSVIYCFPQEINELVQQGLVESNPNAQETDANGNLTGRIAVRATPTAVAPQQPQSAPQPVQTFEQDFAPTPAPAPATEQQPAQQAPAEQVQQTAPKPASADGFEIVSNFTPPERRTRQVRYKYPFDKLGNGEAFFVPATEEMPKPKKKIAAAVGNANKKYRDYSPPRYFKSFTVEKGQNLGGRTVEQDGCYVTRRDEDRPS